MVVVRGEVVAHSPDQGVVYDALPLAKGRAVAFEYVGQVPVRLLVDTGSSYTVVPVQVLRDIGYSADDLGQTVSIMAAGGIL